MLSVCRRAAGNAQTTTMVLTAKATAITQWAMRNGFSFSAARSLFKMKKRYAKVLPTVSELEHARLAHTATKQSMIPPRSSSTARSYAEKAATTARVPKSSSITKATEKSSKLMVQMAAVRKQPTLAPKGTYFKNGLVPRDGRFASRRSPGSARTYTNKTSSARNGGVNQLNHPQATG
eukprot:scaffold831_cov268-Pinguiococcus_pyrenoidosus.AAC.6